MEGTSTGPAAEEQPRFLFGIREPAQKLTANEAGNTPRFPIYVPSAEKSAPGKLMFPGLSDKLATSPSRQPQLGPHEQNLGPMEHTPAPMPPPGNYRMVPLKRNGKGYLLEDNHVFIKSNERNGTFYLKCLAWRHCGARAKIDNKGHAKITTKHDNHDPPDLLSLAFRARVLQAARLPKYSNLSVAQVYHQVKQDSVSVVEQHPSVQNELMNLPQLGSMKTSINRVRIMAGAAPKRKKLRGQGGQWPIMPLGFKIESISRRLVHKAEAVQAKVMLDQDQKHAILEPREKSVSPVTLGAPPSSIEQPLAPSSLITPPPDDPNEWWKRTQPSSEQKEVPPFTLRSECQPVDLSAHTFDFAVHSDQEDVSGLELVVDEATPTHLHDEFPMEEHDYFLDSADAD